MRALVLWLMHNIGNSRMHHWRIAQDFKEKQLIAEQCKSIDSYFTKSTGSEAQDKHRSYLKEFYRKSNSGDNDQQLNRNEKELAIIQFRFDKLDQQVRSLMNSSSKVGKLNAYEAFRLLSIHKYFVYRLEGLKKMEASLRVAKEKWQKSFEYRGRAIRLWAKVYVQLGYLPLHKQGKHAKRESLLSDEDIEKKCLAFLRQLDPAKRSAAVLKTELESVILPSTLGIQMAIPERTVVNYLHEWGYVYRKNSKEVNKFTCHS